jgi:histidinol-phosphate/aromatic aminotransferase/cobyric acid decarboxylase-like protein
MGVVAAAAAEGLWLRAFPEEARLRGVLRIGIGTATVMSKLLNFLQTYFANRTTVQEKTTA